jgi:hypothetical protein
VKRRYRLGFNSIVMPDAWENQPRKNEEREGFLTFLRALRFFVVDFH